MTIPPSDTKFVAIRNILNYMALKSSTVSVSAPRSEKPRGVSQTQWDANPYSDFDYRHTWWQKLWEGLGFRSKFDEFRENMALNSREYDSDLAEKAHNEEYDSAAAQAARERAAGINPDLAGNVDPGSSSGMEPDPNAPISPGSNDPVSIVSGFANTVMSALNGAIGFAKAGLDLSQMRNEVDSGKLSNSQGLFDYAVKLARQYVPVDLPSSGDSDWINRSVDLASEHAGVTLSNRQKSALKNQLGAIYQSAPTRADQWSSWISMMDNTIEGNVKRQSKFWRDGTDEVIMDAVRPLVAAFDKITALRPEAEGAGLAADVSESQYKEDYFDNLNSGLNPSDPNSVSGGALAAKTEMMTNQRNLFSAKIDSYLNTAMEEIIHNLKDRSESNKTGHGLATAALLFFQVMRMMNWTPRFSSGSSQASGPKGDSSSSSFSFGF